MAEKLVTARQIKEQEQRAKQKRDNLSQTESKEEFYARKAEEAEREAAEQQAKISGLAAKEAELLNKIKKT